METVTVRTKTVKKGFVFGRLTVVGDAFREEGKKQPTKVRCRCECGVEKVFLASGLVQGRTRSCGCYKRDNPSRLKHGMRRSKTGITAPEYNAWVAMIDRCENRNDHAYADYGGRGIRMCQRWRNSFEAFYADMGPRPSRNHSIDRIDNALGYAPENCRWATKKEQARNRRSSRYLTVNGESKTAAEWAEITGLSRATIYERMRRGWNPSVILTAKPHSKGYKNGAFTG